MAKVSYYAVLEPATDGVGVYFPDLDGCVSFGGDADEAVANAQEALSLHLEGMAEDGAPPPTRQSLTDLMDARASEGSGPLGYATITVEAPDEAERVNVYLPKSLLERIDTFAKASGLNRSNFFSLAARAFMGGGAVGVGEREGPGFRHQVRRGTRGPTKHG
ncbi:MAG: type II toxin-antitoxin system HicB family antitoxin [Phenylobacterium sp.]